MVSTTLLTVLVVGAAASVQAAPTPFNAIFNVGETHANLTKPTPILDVGEPKAADPPNDFYGPQRRHAIDPIRVVGAGAFASADAKDAENDNFLAKVDLGAVSGALFGTPTTTVDSAGGATASAVAGKVASANHIKTPDQLSVNTGTGATTGSQVSDGDAFASNRTTNVIQVTNGQTRNDTLSASPKAALNGSTSDQKSYINQLQVAPNLGIGPQGTNGATGNSGNSQVKTTSTNAPGRANVAADATLADHRPSGGIPSGLNILIGLPSTTEGATISGAYPTATKEGGIARIPAGAKFGVALQGNTTIGASVSQVSTSLQGPTGTPTQGSFPSEGISAQPSNVNAPMPPFSGAAHLAAIFSDSVQPVPTQPSVNVSASSTTPSVPVKSGSGATQQGAKILFPNPFKTFEGLPIGTGHGLSSGASLSDSNSAILATDKNLVGTASLGQGLNIVVPTGTTTGTTGTIDLGAATPTGMVTDTRLHDDNVLGPDYYTGAGTGMSGTGVKAATGGAGRWDTSGF